MKFLVKAAALTVFLGSLSAMPIDFTSGDDDPWVDNRPCPFLAADEAPSTAPSGSGIIFVPWAFGDLTFNPGYIG
ncbi:MAG: hypothetical protein P0S94_02240 [Simkaniaceae bacterium]|nr:hypothetical protein [Simkaniaceae bacterium]